MIGLIDIGGTKLLAAVADDEGQLHNIVRASTPPDRPMETLRGLLDQARNGEPLTAIAMAVPGPFDRENAMLLNPPGMPQTWWNAPLRRELGAMYSCDVVIENDANCAALAEATLGSGRGHDTVMYITVSTGIGTGLVQRGELYIARHDTEGGHMVVWPEWVGGLPCHCGGYGCLETLASGLAIERRFGMRAEKIEDQTIWDEIGRWLGVGVVNCVAVTDCDCVVFGGGVCNKWSRFEHALRETVKDYLHLQPQPDITLATLGEERNLYGALQLVKAAATL